MFAWSATAIFMAALLLFPFLFGGCTSLPITGSLAEMATITKIATVEEETPFAGSPDGTKVAYVKDTLNVSDLTTGVSRALGAKRPSALAWAPDGTMLATAFPQGDLSTLRIVDLNGVAVRETIVVGHVTKVIWTAKEVLAGAVIIDSFTFGTNVKGILYRWPDSGRPSAMVLSDTTVRPFLSKWPQNEIYRTFTFAASLDGGQVVHTRLQDPPKFSPYLKIMIRNLDNGLDKELARVAIKSAPPTFTTDDEQLVFGNGETAISVIDPWTGKTITTLKSSGKLLAVSPNGSHIMADGHLYLDGKEVATFPATSQGEFMSEGKLLVRYHGNLYLLSGLHGTSGITLPKGKQEQLNALHRWRNEELISIPDYESARERIYR